MKTKKLFLVLLLLVGSIGAMHAQTDYGFKINGTPITSANADDLQSIEGVTIFEGGYLKFDPVVTTLYMRDVVLSSNNGICLDVEEKGSPSFSLRLEGENQFYASDKHAIQTDQNLEITGSGRLLIKTAQNGIFVKGNHTLTITGGCNIGILSEVKEKGYAGIDAYKKEENHLVIDNASLHVTARGTDDYPYPYAIGGFKSITMKNAHISEPENARVDNLTFTHGKDTYTQAFIMVGDKPAREVIIQKEDYGLRINGRKITQANVNDLKNIEGVTIGPNGYLKFDPVTTTLYMKDVTLKNDKHHCLKIESYSSFFYLNLEGKNHFETSSIACFAMKDMKIYGRGSLSIKTPRVGISQGGGYSVTQIEGCSIDILSEATEYNQAGIDALTSEESHLFIRNASLHVKAIGKENNPHPYAIGGFKFITIEDAHISQPTNSKVGNYDFPFFGSTLTRSFIMEGDKPAREVTIQKERYGFYINGTEVTLANVNNIKDIAGVTIGTDGYLKFDPATTTLSMKNVTILDANNKECLVIGGGLSSFTIRLEGENRFEADNNVAVKTHQNLRIAGPGSLFIKTPKTGLYVGKSYTLTISDGCNIDILSEAKADGYAGISGFHEFVDSHLVIRNASLHVKATGTDDHPYPYAIGNFKSIIIEDAHISQPENARIDNLTFTRQEHTYTGSFIMEGDKPAREVKIQKGGAIKEIEEVTLSLYPNPADHYVRVEGAQVHSTLALYSLDGVRILTAEANEVGRAMFDLSSLPSGNYIVKAANGSAYRLVVTR